jgi:hypothetical protein
LHTRQQANIVLAAFFISFSHSLSRTYHKEVPHRNGIFTAYGNAEIGFVGGSIVSESCTADDEASTATEVRPSLFR